MTLVKTNVFGYTGPAAVGTQPMCLSLLGEIPFSRGNSVGDSSAGEAMEMVPISANVLDVEKCIEVLLYVTKRVGDMYTALKIVYFADRDHLERYGTLIYGDTYFALQHGPVPSLGVDILKDNDNGFPCPVAREARGKFHHQGYSRIPVREPDLEYLSASDIECLDRSIAENGPLSFNQLKRKSHDGAYKSADRNDVISLENIARDLPSGDALLEHVEEW